MFGLKAVDVGRPLQDLEVSYRPVELRSVIEQVRADRRPITTKEVEWRQPDGETRYLDVPVSPLSSVTGEFIGVAVTFTDVSRYRALHEELERARRDLETAYEELQSTVEELETTNEELQSTNEELETMNDELRERTDAAMGASTFLSSILGSIRQVVVVVDGEFRVRAWSDAATELWGMRSDEIREQNFLNLDIGLPVAELREPMRRVLSGDDAEAVELDAHNRRGQPIHCRVSFAPLTNHRDDSVEGVILVITAERLGT